MWIPTLCFIERPNRTFPLGYWSQLTLCFWVAQWNSSNVIQKVWVVLFVFTQMDSSQVCGIDVLQDFLLILGFAKFPVYNVQSFWCARSEYVSFACRDVTIWEIFTSRIHTKKQLTHLTHSLICCKWRCSAWFWECISCALWFLGLIYIWEAVRLMGVYLFVYMPLNMYISIIY